MAVDVVVTNYKTPDLLQDFIASYEAHKFPGCHLTIVDVSPEAPALYPHEHTYIAKGENIGYGRACNLGAQMGHNDVILLANADTLLTSGLAECYDALVANEDWGVLGPRQIDEQGRLSWGGIFGPDTAPAHRGWQEFDVGQYTDVRDDGPMVNGSLLFTKRALWEELATCPTYTEHWPGSSGPFLETTHYYEETWYCYHARAHGAKCIYYGAVTMTHLWHKASAPGGWADQQQPVSMAKYQAACKAHKIVCG